MVPFALLVKNLQICPPCTPEHWTVHSDMWRQHMVTDPDDIRSIVDGSIHPKKHRIVQIEEFFTDGVQTQPH